MKKKNVLTLWNGPIPKPMPTPLKVCSKEMETTLKNKQLHIWLGEQNKRVDEKLAEAAKRRFQPPGQSKAVNQRSIIQIVHSSLPKFPAGKRRNVSATKETSSPYRFILEQFFSENGPIFYENHHDKHVDEALQLAKSITEPKEKDRIFQNIALGVAKYGNSAKALKIINLISNRKSKEQVLTHLIAILAEQGEMQCAEELLSTIRNPSHRKEAILSLIQCYLNFEEYEEAIRFVEKIKIHEEKVLAAKRILHHSLSSHNRKLADKVHHRFSSLALS